MVKVAMPAKIALAACLYAAVATAETINFINKCSFPIELYHSQSGSTASKVADIPVGSSLTEDVTGPAHMYRHSAETSATLVELACDGTLWNDLSVIPPMPGYCSSYEECKKGGKTGFNVPISIEPKENIGKGTCSALYCAADDKEACADAYHYPMDNTKTHSCPSGTELDGTVQSYADLGKVKAKYEYKGKNAGNMPGSYNRVTDLATCTKEPVQVNSPVGPMSEPCSMIFRGPQEIFNIAVYSDEGGNGSWPRVSSYSSKDGTVENLTFMNNKNVDYSGQNEHGPQGYASADGKDKADKPTVFSGELVEASDPTKIGGGPGISTGVEINIMTGEKCNGECLGFSGDNDYKGWGGGKKAFVTEVKMPKGLIPDQPAIWMLNAQVMHSNQYGCNCRGMGPVGGCGELDIAEVIETNPLRNKVTTHLYYYDGSVLSPGGDNFAPRSYDSNTVYVTLIDDSNEGLIKIVELESFDFSQTELGSLYQQLVDC
ncbi:secretory protein OPEL [Phytophthora infestans T30-4]|uniref:glucan endo-1,3-beta-D-glucosidase n=1 Tax=Phytophthora infestans (strain T30-4) TaxID=403677 RepID=D0N3P2_PHYIT|nr:secretory protein OPEL [Phytophthora infestans T30-4]EEY68996.1 secretory protein OPEL [Phytophthora infestans T30-4]|eukprot:XP_002998850.1 secretory protein OPEL [Phytophthora infestans T30-4]